MWAHSRCGARGRGRLGLVTHRNLRGLRAMTTDLATEILREIRDGIGALREDFNERRDQTKTAPRPKQRAPRARRVRAERPG